LCAFNHMTGNTTGFHDVCKYGGTQTIQIVDGSTLPITAVGTLGSSFQNVFISPGLSTNLIFLGQLVDNNCDVHFSRGGCLVQDQVSGMVIAKGSKVGRLFPLQFSISILVSFACTITANNNEVWHKKLGHPNSAVLTHLLKHGHLGNKDSFFPSPASFNCVTCHFGKSKTLLFPAHGTCASTCFEIVHIDV